jgi:hypothetical protein
VKFEKGYPSGRVYRWLGQVVPEGICQTDSAQRFPRVPSHQPEGGESGNGSFTCLGPEGFKEAQIATS